MPDRCVFAAEQFYENLDNQQGGNLSRTVMGICLIICLYDDIRKAYEDSLDAMADLIEENLDTDLLKKLI